MSILEQVTFQRSYGATVLSRRPLVRLTAAISDDSLTALQIGWNNALSALKACLQAVEVNTAAIDRLPSRPDAVDSSRSATAQLVARCSVALMQKARAPQGDFGDIPAAAPKVCAYWNDWMDDVGLTAGRTAITLVEAAFAGGADLDNLAKTALKAVYDSRADAFVLPMILGANQLNIPWRSLRPGGLLMSCGQGNRQKLFRGTLSNEQSRACVHLTTRKHLSIQLLKAAGLPVPEHELAGSPAAAVAAARRIGFPVVVKPEAGSRAQNIALNLESDAAVAEAFKACHALGLNTLVEKQCPGLPFRVAIQNGRAFASARHAVPYVVGDGKSSIAELIDKWNQRHSALVADPYRLPTVLRTDLFQDELSRRLRDQNLAMKDIPKSGQDVFLAYIPALSMGGVHVDMTDLVHSSILDLAEEAARVLRSPSLGVDFITTDFSKPVGEVPLVINEVNAAPSARTHLIVPSAPKNLATAVLEASFPQGDQGRIPTVAALGETAAGFLQPLEHLLTLDGETVGYADSRRARVGAFELRPGEGVAAHPGCALLRDKRPALALMQVGTADINARGLPSDRLDVVALPRPFLTAKARQVVASALAVMAPLPGRALLLPYDAGTDGLAGQAGHREIIYVAGQPYAAEGLHRFAGQNRAVVVAVAGLPGQPRLVAYHGGREDPLGRLPLAQKDHENFAWMAAVLLGLGYRPLKITKIISRGAEDGYSAAAGTPMLQAET